MANARAMPRAAKPLLNVYPNPYAAIDHEGRPASAVLLDPVEHYPYANDEEPRKFVGATLVCEQVKKETKYSPAKYEHGFEFTFAPVTLPATDYYKQHVKTGDLVAADPATYALCGCKAETFRDPLVLLAEAKEAAIGRRAREHGADAILPETQAHWAKHLPDLAAKRAAHEEANKAVAAKLRAAAEAGADHDPHADAENR